MLGFCSRNSNAWKWSISGVVVAGPTDLCDVLVEAEILITDSPQVSGTLSWICVHPNRGTGK